MNDVSFNINMSDKEIVKALIAHDERVTAKFFYKDCRPLFTSIIRRVFDNQMVDYEEIISELYILLMENDAQRLRQFHFESSLYQWLKTIAIRHCLKLKNGGRVIDVENSEPLNDKDNGLQAEEISHAKMDLDNLLGQMKNQRYAKVIRCLMLDDLTPEEVAKELNVTTDNLYNIKRRAMNALTEVALKDKKYYEQRI